MSDEKLIQFDLREVTEALIKHKGITEGRWMLAVEFGIRAMNAGPDNQHISPAALVPMVSAGLTRVSDTDDNNLVVDAAKLK